MKTISNFSAKHLNRHFVFLSLFLAIFCLSQTALFAQSKQVPLPVKSAVSDFDGDGKTDYAVFRPSDGTWYILKSSTGTLFAQTFGLATDKPVPADYDGDGKTDIAVYRNTDGYWYIMRSSDQSFQATKFGLPNEDEVVPADYDGDGKTDLAVFRRTTGIWYLLRSRDGFAAFNWGTPAGSMLIDLPYPGDFDGDGRSDLAVFRVRTGQWFILQSSDSNVRVENFSASPLKAPIAADFDGDEKDDPGVIDSTSNEGLNWQIKQSSGSILFAFAGQGGINFDYPILGDFNGDGKNDLTTWTPGTGTYTVSLPNSQIIRTRWGMRGDKPLTAGKVIQVTGGGDIIVSAF